MYTRLAAAGLLTLALQQPARAQHLSSPLNLVFSLDSQLLVASGTNVVFYDVDGATVTYDHSFSTAPYTPFQLQLGPNSEILVGMTDGDLDVYASSGALVSTLRGEAGLSFAYLSNKSVVSTRSASAVLFNAKGKQKGTFTQDAQGRPFAGGVVAPSGTAMYYAFDDPKTGNSLIETFSAASFVQGDPTEREHFTNAYTPHAVQIAIDHKQCEYVVGNDSLTVYTHPGVQVYTVTGLAQPGGVAVDPTGSSCTDKKPTYYVYVTETAANDIKVFDPQGNLVNTVR